MKRFICCIKGGGALEDPQQPPEQPEQPPEQVHYEHDEINNDAAFGNNEFLNNAWRNNTELPDDREYSDSSDVLFPSSPPLPTNCGVSFPWHEIFDGTKNLQQTYFLGRGDFGEVYRCDLTRINQVGIAKIQNLEYPSGPSEFVAEVTTLHAASHPNVIRLLGKCYGRRNRAIVYEFMPNGSLERHLFQHASQSQSQGQGSQGLLQPQVLDWDARMRIAVGVAEGLVYLHQELKVIHRNVKAGNILLDENFVPKLTDFGLATKIVEDEHGIEHQISEINPTKGTPGYIAPEAEESGLISTKTDVYSYGVFLLVLFTGRKAYGLVRPEARKKLTDWVVPVGARGKYAPLVPAATLGHKFSLGAFNKIIHTVRRCIHAQALGRPNMNVVETMVREAADFPVQGEPTVNV